MREGKGGLEERARAEGKREKGRCAREGLITVIEPTTISYDGHGFAASQEPWHARWTIQ